VCRPETFLEGQGLISAVWSNLEASDQQFDGFSGLWFRLPEIKENEAAMFTMRADHPVRQRPPTACAAGTKA
jgi:hypothetical protein